MALTRHGANGPGSLIVSRVMLAGIAYAPAHGKLCGPSRQGLDLMNLPTPEPPGGCYPGRTGGPWLCRTFVLPGFHAVVVPSGFRTSVQPHRWMTTWW
jgi:hypothetical protein